MRYVKAALLGIIAAVLLTAAVLAVDMIRANRVAAAQMAKCEAANAEAGRVVCGGRPDVGGNELEGAFVLGFAATFSWSVRRPRLARRT